MKVLRISDSEDHVSTAFVRNGGLRWIAEGSVLMVTRGMILDHTVPIALAMRPLTINQDMKGLVPRGGLLGRFLAWLLIGLNPAILARVEEAAHGTKALRTEQWRKLPLAVPPEPLQRRIADFLDRKTAAIDALIAKKERLVELLAEKRQALITQAVTKGLDPNVAMKESGIPGVGQIPRHWRVMRLKHISPRQTVGVVVNPSAYYAEEGVPFLFGGNTREGGFCLDGVRRISSESNRILAKSVLRTGDLVTVRVGYPGVTAVIPPKLDGCNCASMMIVRRSQQFSSEWLCFAMNSVVGRRQVEVVQYGAAQEQFNLSHAVEFRFPVPPLPEQREIAQEVGQGVGQLAELRTRLGSSITNLREYRQALITAAVTGQLDVTAVDDATEELDQVEALPA
jgi:type I restriction enzyme S subunit